MERHLLIFGANGVLGQGVTECMLKKDYNKIYLFGSRKTDIPENPRVFQIHTGNLSEEAEVVKAFENVKPSKDALFFLFSTIGGFTGGSNLWDSELDDLEKMLNTNVKANFLIGKYFSRLVKGSAGGSIVFMAAMTGLNPEKGKIPYGLSKSGLVYLVETLALEGVEMNLTANAIAPNMIDTPANRSWMGENYAYETLIKPVEVGELVDSVFQNYRFVSGNVIRLPGRVKQHLEWGKK